MPGAELQVASLSECLFVISCSATAPETGPHRTALPGLSLACTS